MRIKTYQGRSLEDVLPKIREELGAGAVVLGQRQKVTGGVAGFFGTRVVEVTAADRMPDDEQLVELEDRMMQGEDLERAVPAAATATATATARPGVRMGRVGGIDVVDDWDPAGDAELAQEYGRVLEHAAAAGAMSDATGALRPHAATSQYADLELPVVDRAAGPEIQARALVDQAHRHLAASAERVDRSFQAATPGSTYGPPAPLPTVDEPVVRSFTASVVDSRDQAPVGHVAAPPVGRDAAEAVRGDLGFAPGDSANDHMSDAISAAVDQIDVRAMAALRNAMHASRRLQEQDASRFAPELEAEMATVTARMSQTGVDTDVSDALVDMVLRHRRPFGSHAPHDLEQMMREVVEETLDVRTGFPTVGRPYRIAMVGASTSGKTTAAAKLAHGYSNAGLRVGVIVLLANDPSSAVSQDHRFEGRGLDVSYAGSTEQARQSAATFAEHDLVVVDTPGAAYRDEAAFAQLRASLDAIGVDDVHVVVPVTTSGREAESVIDAFRPLGANRLLPSRLDESRHIGQLLNFGFRLGMPMTYVSEGPRIPEDLRAASAREIAARIIPPLDHA